MSMLETELRREGVFLPERSERFSTIMYYAQHGINLYPEHTPRTPS
jgi:hypothetical protein